MSLYVFFFYLFIFLFFIFDVFGFLGRGLCK